MLGHFYYFITLILIFFNLLFLLNFSKFYKTAEWIDGFKKVTGKIPEPKDFKDNDHQLLSFLGSVVILNFFWIFLGILSKSWVIYLLILGSGIINILINSFLGVTIGKFSIFTKIFNLFYLILIILSLSVLTINHFHLHLELSQYIF
jgi:hypothetical protein